MSRTAFATVATILATVMFSAPAFADSNDNDCLNNSDWKITTANAGVRYEVHFKNNTKETLTADFYENPNATTETKYASKVMSPGQKIDILRKVHYGTKLTVRTQLTSNDGSSTYVSNLFTLQRKGGNGDSKYFMGSFDPKLTCDRRWNAAMERWIINYVINPG
ncbi:MAG: hypothetical protein GC201_13630 [Alphaproteobacteria bacterium]|nr:hypothetical protein [Alphaproteobacteria bacterium]